MTFAILHISDLHFGKMMKTASSGLVRRMLGISEHSYELCVSLCDEVDLLRRTYPNNLMVAVTGDQTTSANAAANGVVANFLNGKHFISQGIQVGLQLNETGHLVPGNHDKFLSTPFTQRSRAEVYGEYFPSTFPSWKIWEFPTGFVTVFGLDSNQVSGFNPLNFRNLNRHGEVGEKQRGDLLALQGRLRRATASDVPAGYNYEDSYKVVLLHHHLVRPDRPVANTRLLDHAQLVELFSKMNIDLVLCGHEHVPFHAMVGTTKPFRFSCAGSTTKQDERFNTFKVYHVDTKRSVEMDVYRASSAGGLFTFLKEPRVPLL